MNRIAQQIAGLLLVGLCAGCTKSSVHKWEHRAAEVAPGTPRAQVLALLPPTGTVLDLRSGGTGGPITYLVDKYTIVKIIIDHDDTLARPIVVETLHDKKKTTRSTSRPSIRYGASGSGALPSGK
jgi:hypothetical protein